MTTPAKVLPTPPQLQAKPLGPDSLMWRHFGDSRFLLFVGQAVTMQAAHPIIAQSAVDHNSALRSDTLGRLQRSLAMLWPCVYNTPEGALEYATKLREMHRSIKGKMPDGKAYHAFDPEAYLWVHMDVFDAVLRLATLKGEPLTPTQEEQLYEEWRQMGLLLGIREQDLPTDIPAFWTRFNDIIQKSLAMSSTLKEAMSADFYLRVPRRPVSWLPKGAWKQMYQPLGKLGWLVTRATMPEQFREKFQVALSPKEQRRFRRLVSVLNLSWKLLPENVRYLPQAYKAIEDARRHPEKYRAQVTA